MSIAIAILFLFLIPLLVVSNQYKGLIAICLLSLICNLFYFDFFGTRIPLHSYVVLCTFPFIIPHYYGLYVKKEWNFLWILSLEFISLLVLAIVFSFVYPWELPGKVEWNQGPLGRSIVAMFRFFLDIGLAVFIHFCIVKKKITIKQLLMFAVAIAFTQIFIGLIDFFANYPIRTVLFTERQIPGRYLGLSHEPRSMARNTSFVLILAFCAYISERKKFDIGGKSLMVLLFGILFTVSVSSLIALSISAILFFLIKNKRNSFKYLVAFTLIGFISFKALKATKFYENNVIPRIVMVTIGGKEFGFIKDEPLAFTRLEIIDRAAANFFYHYPFYLLTGTGPNLIGIPSSKYRTASAKETYGSTITAVPGTGLIYVLGRNGVFGLLILVILYFHLRKMVAQNEFRSNLLFLTFFFFFFIHPSWFFFNIGLISTFPQID